MVYRVFVEKKPGLRHEASGLRHDIRHILLIKNLSDVRLLNRYDVEGVDQDVFDDAVKKVLSEPQLDDTYTEMPVDEKAHVFAVEFLPGQYDQRADSAAQCIQILRQVDRPLVRSAKVYMLYGDLTEAEIAEIKKYVINPVEAREASLEKPETLSVQYDIPTTVETLDGFIEESDDQLKRFLDEKGLAMDLDDLRFCRDYFRTEHRNPTITEIRMIDTYWSDHCRHTTFLTTIDNVSFADATLEKAWNRYLDARKEINRTKPINLMDLGTIAAKVLKKEGILTKLDESEEINACTVKINIKVDGEDQKWLLLFKNETHNHPTEIEPFGGAATCIGGAIRDPLSGRAYVYHAMRVTGAGDPTVPVKDTLEGKLPQRKLVTTAADGYSSYGNQIGLATGLVDELYHPGYVAKRMEIGAVVAAAPEENVRREVPAPGDVVILLGGRTGRDGIGGATGSSKAHNVDSLAKDGAEVQKGNAPEERKLQRLFRNPEASKLIKRCNDFGAGGVSVAIGELADGLYIDLNKVPKKYEGLDGTELAISESQERMAVVVAPEDEDKFMELAKKENLEATHVATVQAERRLVAVWNGKKVIDLSRDFLNSNGAEKHIDIVTKKPETIRRLVEGSFSENYEKLSQDLNVVSKRGLSEEFDSTIGAGTVLMPFGGKYQRTPIQAMAAKVSVEIGHTDATTVMAYGYNPYVTEKDPYKGAYLAVVESAAKLIASGASFDDTYLTFQEYFGKPGRVPERWGQPLEALLGAFSAQLDLGIAAIGGKDSMSGTFEKLDVPPTLVSFAITTEDAANILSPEYKAAGHKVLWLKPKYVDELPTKESLLAMFKYVHKLVLDGKLASIYTPTYGGVAEAVLKQCMGNGFGFDFAPSLSVEDIFGYQYGSFLLELKDAATVDEIYHETSILDAGVVIADLGVTTDDAEIRYNEEALKLSDLEENYEDRLEKVFKCNMNLDKDASETADVDISIPDYSEEEWIAPAVVTAKPRVLIPVFPGNNCEYDSAKACRDAGLDPEIVVIRNMTKQDIMDSVSYVASEIEKANLIFIPGGFSGGDEPDGSAKFFATVFRNPVLKEAVDRLYQDRDGLILGICNGFQTLIKLGLVPNGEIAPQTEDSPTLTMNTIGRHISRMAYVRIVSNKSPWLMGASFERVYANALSHGEGRFVASREWIEKLYENGQVATQYVDPDGNPTMDETWNQNGSYMAIEGITSPDGRILGRMGHPERCNEGVFVNIHKSDDMNIFKSGVAYFK